MSGPAFSQELEALQMPERVLRLEGNVLKPELEVGG